MKKSPAIRKDQETQTYPLRSNSNPSTHQTQDGEQEELIRSTSVSSLHAQSSTGFIPISNLQSNLNRSASTSKLHDHAQTDSSYMIWRPKQFTAAPSSIFTPVESFVFPSTTTKDDRKESKSPFDQVKSPNLPKRGSYYNAASKSKSRKTAFLEHPQREMSPSFSYENSKIFFGALANGTPSTSNDRTSSHIGAQEVLQTLDKVSEVSNTSKLINEDDDNYSAASYTRRHSNPFMSYYTRKPSKVVRPRSVSQALSQMSKNAGLRTRFSEPSGEPNLDKEGFAAVPWYLKFTCLFRCCPDCSVYDPICNLKCCFPYLQIFWLITMAFGFCAIWLILVAILGDLAWPGGEIFQFYTLSLASYLTGWAMACINIPPSIGMFAAGILFGNLGWFKTRSSISNATRAIVVAFILVRAGLNTEASIFKTRGGLISRMAFVPGISEMLVASLCASFFLNMPWNWALLFGCSIAPLSPLAIIYSLVKLRESGYGEDKGVTSVLLMMYALDNITLVTVFGFFFTLTFDFNIDELKIYMIVLQTVGSICGAIGVGFLIGTFFTFFPHRYDPYCGIWRTILLSSGGLGTILIAHSLRCDGAGYLCTIVMSFTSNMGWKAMGTPNCSNPVNMVFAMGWHVLQPIALGLIGAEVNIFLLEFHTIKRSLIIIPFCMVTRFSMVFLMTGMSGFNYKERLFMALLALTKGTPQAALAPVVVELSRGDRQSHFAKHLLHACVLEVFITLPLGPLVASFTGSKLLKKPPVDQQSISTYLYRESEEKPFMRQRYKSMVNRINTDNEFMLYTETGEDDNIV